ncbi:MAG: phospholipase A [Desulfobulbaceae bacterium]|uniref:Phosphatidylcholine 1-acylhydrolase n=1 Tax=Candidatus Desulfatifera sulfidica TaxID=2841691 RepID=A0A8J6N728_9BACT|nr:phospholipase A [Candidatus Desulfatifera sulfidica]
MKPIRTWSRLFLVCTSLMTWPTLAPASDYEKCTSIISDSKRLACYDQITTQLRTVTASTADSEKLPTIKHPVAAAKNSILGKNWELDEDSKKGTFHFREYKPVYILPITSTNSTNEPPYSPAPDHSVLSPEASASTAVKFQLSFKTKVWEDILGDNGTLWFAYTQQSHWLLYNKDTSSPFRETNYEPEVIFSWRTDVELPGFQWRMLNLGLAHESNGRGLPRSRSWNRVYAQFGLEQGNLSLLVRPWVRLPEGIESDDNPDITRYLGDGDLLIKYKRGENIYSALGRYSLSGGRGAVQLDWGFPLSKTFKGYVQIFSGYGESLIDYNHKQTSIGLGVSFLDWW